MIKFVINQVKSKTSIVEVRCETVGKLESRLFLHEGESAIKILAPEMLFEKQPDKSLKEPIWHSFAFYDTLDEALAAAKVDITITYERNCYKSKVDMLDSDLRDLYSSIEIVRL